MKRSLLVLLFINGYLLSGVAQSKPLSAEQQQLSFLKGHWTVEGSEDNYLEICDWIQGNHMQCISVSKEKAGTDSSMSFLSYLSVEKKYVYYGLYGSGGSRTLRGDWLRDKFLFEGQRITPEKTTRWKVTLTPVKENLHFIEEFSINGGPWEKRADFIYKRIK